MSVVQEPNVVWTFEGKECRWHDVEAFSKIFAYASPEIREKIRKKLEWADDFENTEPTTVKHIDWSHAVDLGHVQYGWGKYYLYIWLDGNGAPFYVGQSDNMARPGEYKYKTRSEEFKNVVRGGMCHSVVVAKHLPKSRVLELEKDLISYFCWLGYPLTNSRDLPSGREIELGKEVAKNSKESIEDVFANHSENYWHLKKLFPVLNEVIGQKWGGECAVLQ